MKIRQKLRHLAHQGVLFGMASLLVLSGVVLSSPRATAEPAPPPPWQEEAFWEGTITQEYTKTMQNGGITTHDSMTGLAQVNGLTGTYTQEWERQASQWPGCSSSATIRYQTNGSASTIISMGNWGLDINFGIMAVSAIPDNNSVGGNYQCASGESGEVGLVTNSIPECQNYADIIVPSTVQAISITVTCTQEISQPEDAFSELTEETIIITAKKPNCDVTVDSDQDGLGDCAEYDSGGTPYSTPLSPPSDADNDGRSDYTEGQAENVDTDNDGTPDYLDEDSDNDGTPDNGEYNNDNNENGVYDWRDPNEPAQSSPDSDNDGIWDVDEPDYGTLPNDADTDDDGVVDGLDNCATIKNHLQNDGDKDGVGNACENALGGDLGFICGEAAFDHHFVTLNQTATQAGEEHCTFLFSNRLTQELFDHALLTGSTLTEVFADEIKGFVDQQLTERDIRIKWKQAGLRWAKKVFPEAARGMRLANFSYVVAEAATYAAVPIAGSIVVNHIRENEGCIQVTAGISGDKVDVDWSIVHNPDHWSGEAVNTKAHAWEKIDRRFQQDTLRGHGLGLNCISGGNVKTVDVDLSQEFIGTPTRVLTSAGNL